MIKDRNGSIDFIKGVLILTVIAGHALLGSLDDNIIRFVIYSFHMPLFLFISGYLIKIEKIVNLSVKELFSKYWTRMLKEWLVALVIYTSLLCISQGVSIKQLVLYIFMPYYHLWYVPILMVMILSSWVIEKRIADNSQKIFVYLVLGLTLYGIYNVGYNLLAEYRLHFFSFFYLGSLCKHFENSYRGRPAILGGVSLLFLCIVVLFYFIDFTYSEYRVYFLLPFNIALCVWFILPMIRRNKLKSDVLQYIGYNSLHIYLWHVLFIIAIKKLSISTINYYSILFVAIIIYFVLIKVKVSYENNKTVSDC